MLLQPGTQLGSYEVLSNLGSGRMDEVYQAQDVTLGPVTLVRSARILCAS